MLKRIQLETNRSGRLAAFIYVRDKGPNAGVIPDARSEYRKLVSRCEAVALVNGFSNPEWGVRVPAEKTMTDENKFDAQSRRKFLKTTGAVGVAATAGVGAFGGQAAAQGNLDVNADNVLQSGLINVSDIDIDVLNINVEDVTVRVQNIDVTVTDVIDVNNNTINVEVNENEILNNSFNNNVVNVVVSILSDTGRLVGVDQVRL